MLKQHIRGFARKFFLCLMLGLGASQAALAALFEANPANFGAPLTNTSNCDDCFDGPIAFGAGHSLEFFGTTYNDLYVSSNGYITFGSGASNWTSVPLDVQTIRPMIAGLFTDLDSRSDATSQVFANTATPGQIIVTWVGMGHCCTTYAVRSTFQLVIRSDQSTIPAGQGRIGFFYDSVTDTASASAGFGDGLAAVNPGEVAFHSLQPASALNNAAPRWYNLSGGVPTPPTAVQPVPTLSEWSLIVLGLALASAAGLARSGRRSR